jgi:hypothetical protein
MTMSNRTATETLAYAYTKAKLRVLTSSFGPEIIWQKNVRPEELTEAVLLRESAWVIISSGMRESVVRRKFPQIAAAFLNWTSARQIVRHRKECVRTALRHFHHEGKIDAIARGAQIIDERGFRAIRKEILCDPISAFRQFPYMGPATSFHLAKSIGFPVVKPDRHLIRLAALAGYERPADFCSVIAEYIGDPVSVVDIVLWRYATLHRNYLTAFLPVGRGNV